MLEDSTNQDSILVEVVASRGRRMETVVILVDVMCSKNPNSPQEPFLNDVAKKGFSQILNLPTAKEETPEERHQGGIHC